MLCLTRKIQESIIIDDTIEVILLKVEGNRAVLGIRADRRVPIRRAEVCLPKPSEDQR